MGKVNECSIKIDTTSCYNGFTALKTNAETALEMLVQTAAGKMEAYAKTNAPWTDRTGAARRQLTGEAYWQSREVIVAALHHMVDYGIWLELAHQKKYAILMEAVESQKDDLLSGVEKVIKKL